MCVPPVLLWAQDFCNSILPCAAQAMSELDEFKVFLGGLHANCWKPKIVDVLKEFGLCWTDIHVPPIKVAGDLGITLVIFDLEDEAQRCIHLLKGCTLPALTTSMVQAGRTTTWEPV